jgi:ATP-dependent Lon protease
LSSDNKKDILEIKTDYTKDLKFHYVDTMTEVLDLALLSQKVRPIKANKK